MEWDEALDCDRQSHAETAMFRYEAVICSRPRARTLSAQNTETKVARSVLNRKACLGMPMSLPLR